MNKDKVIILGASGSLGSNLFKYLNEKDKYQISGFDKHIDLNSKIHKIDLNEGIFEILEKEFPNESNSCVHLVNAIGRITSERVISLKKWDNSNMQDFIENSKIQLIENYALPIALSIQFANKLLSKRLSGSIINFSSVVAKGNPGQINYAASKAAVESATKTLCKEYAKTGIRFNCVSPGFIEVNSTLNNVTTTNLKEISERTPTGKLGQPESVSHIIETLISNQFCNGSIYSVDGGLVI